MLRSRCTGTWGRPLSRASTLAQTLSYLKATGLRLGLLVNFGERHLKADVAAWCSPASPDPSLGGLAPWRLSSPLLRNEPIETSATKY